MSPYWPSKCFTFSGFMNGGTRLKYTCADEVNARDNTNQVSGEWTNTLETRKKLVTHNAALVRAFLERLELLARQVGAAALERGITRDGVLVGRHHWSVWSRANEWNSERTWKAW